MPMAQISWYPRRRSRHWSNRARLNRIARIEVAAGSRTLIGRIGSGGHELVGVAMDAVAQAPTRGVARDGHGSHDLADGAQPAEQVTPGGHPAPDVGRIAVELERARVERGALRPVRRDFGGHDIEEVDPPGRALDHLEAAVTAGRNIILDDRRDPD